MQLDKTRIVIRERGWLDLQDLALAIFRARGPALLAALTIGVLPWALLNHWLLTRALGGDVMRMETGWFVFGQFWLALFEIPFATAPLTIYLGSWLFCEPTQPREIAGRLVSSLPQLLIYQLLLRGVLFGTFLLAFVPFAVWPFLNEIILLERNPLLARKANQISTGRRSSALHAGLSGEMLGRGVGATVLGLLLTWAMVESLAFARAVLGGGKSLDWYYLTVEFPVAMWLVIGFMAVTRFLGYLDVRIRREGWEVQLAMHAEANRLNAQLV